MSKISKFKQIYVEITKKCNLNCPFCPSSSNRDENLSIIDFHKIIERTAGFTDVYYLHLLGEPLVNKDLDGILRVAEVFKKKVRITTNGTLIHLKKDILLSAKSLDRVNISLQSWYYLDKEVWNALLEAQTRLYEQFGIDD